MKDLCANCGLSKQDHLLANYADGPNIGASILVCPRSLYKDYGPPDEKAAQKQEQNQQPTT